VLRLWRKVFLQASKERVPGTVGSSAPHLDRRMTPSGRVGKNATADRQRWPWPQCTRKRPSRVPASPVRLRATICRTRDPTWGENPFRPWAGIWAVVTSRPEADLEFADL